MLALVTLPLLLLSSTPQQDVDSLLVLARTGTDSALVDQVKRRRAETRFEVGGLLRATGAAGDSDTATLAAAERLASAYATAWNDSTRLSTG